MDITMYVQVDLVKKKRHIGNFLGIENQLILKRKGKENTFSDSDYDLFLDPNEWSPTPNDPANFNNKANLSQNLTNLWFYEPQDAEKS
jgi:hypothetical protein